MGECIGCGRFAWLDRHTDECGACRIAEWDDPVTRDRDRWDWDR